MANGLSRKEEMMVLNEAYLSFKTMIRTFEKLSIFNAHYISYKNYEQYTKKYTVLNEQTLLIAIGQEWKRNSHT